MRRSTVRKPPLVRGTVLMVKVTVPVVGIVLMLGSL
jgi:hypothetical protein